MTTEAKIVDELAAALDPTATERLHARLVRAAERERLLDIAYRTVPTPVGELLLAATELGLVRVAYAEQGQERIFHELGTRISSRILHVPARLDAAAQQLDEYFEGRRTRFELPLDFRLARGFRRAVLEQLPERVPYGRTAGYAELAVAAGSPRAVRAVGSACANNPLPVVVPCHRVVRSDGTPGGYVGGAAAKRTLLGLEAS